jgi:hypothetical protein
VCLATCAMALWSKIYMPVGLRGFEHAFLYMWMCTYIRKASAQTHIVGGFVSFASPFSPLFLVLCYCKRYACKYVHQGTEACSLSLSLSLSVCRPCKLCLSPACAVASFNGSAEALRTRYSAVYKKTKGTRKSSCCHTACAMCFDHTQHE